MDCDTDIDGRHRHTLGREATDREGSLRPDPTAGHALLAATLERLGES